MTGRGTKISMDQSAKERRVGLVRAVAKWNLGEKDDKDGTDFQ